MLKIKLLYSNHKKDMMQAIKYIITGGASFVSDYSMFLILIHSFHYEIATYAGLIIGLIVNYLMSKIWVFKNNNSVDTREIISFIIVTAIGFAFTGIGMYIGVDILHIDEKIAKLIVAILVFVFNFLARKYVVWKES